MTIEQTIEVPANRRVFFEFLAPKEIPEGKAKVELKVTPVIEDQEKKPPKNTSEGTAQHTDALLKILSQPTPRADALLGIFSDAGDITLEQIQEERLANHIK